MSYADKIFLEVLESNRRHLVALAARVVGCAWRGEEIVQDAYVRIIRASATPQDIRHPLGYLKRVIFRLAIDARRAKAVERAYAQAISFPDRRSTSTDGAGDADMLRPDAIEILTPERQLTSQDELRRVLACLDGLPPRTRRAFELSQFYGHKQREVAEILGVSSPRVHAMLRQAFQRITEQLGEE
ncbi:sigma-70 family RNA polymerase sigma factor [Komagataeibacter xylinus]